MLEVVEQCCNGGLASLESEKSKIPDQAMANH
jgi:hypothetical protein